jgi:hypothetical protein
MRGLTATPCAVLAALAVSAPLALAGPGGGGGGGMSGGMGGGFGGFGGNSAPHVGSQGVTNSNGPNSTDRDLGTNRAGDVMSTQGATHKQIPSDVGLPTPPAGSGH